MDQLMQSKIKKLQEQVNSVFAGKDEIVHNTLAALFGSLHLLIEDIPGVGKTTLARTLAKSAGMDFGRIQFTPDLLPGDILGMTVYNNQTREFTFKPGAVMHQFVLADEINRATARTQSSLLEAMQEESVTVDDKTFKLPDPFFVIATQNPVSFAGTFELPEAQLDRFGMSFSIGYPLDRIEKQILIRFKGDDPVERLAPVISSSEISTIRLMVQKIFVHERIMDFIIKIAGFTRSDKRIKLGMSPRASRHLMAAAQAEAFIWGRDYVVPEDVVQCAPFVLNHRLILTAQARMENLSADLILKDLISKIPVPTGLNYDQDQG